MPVRSLAWSVLLLLSSIALAFGQHVGNPAAGKQLAEGTCLGCHGAQNTARKAPAFSAIAAMPSTSAGHLWPQDRRPAPAPLGFQSAEAERVRCSWLVDWPVYPRLRRTMRVSPLVVIF